MLASHQITLLGTRPDRNVLHDDAPQPPGVATACTSSSPEVRIARRTFAGEHGIPHATSDMAEAIQHPETDVVVIGLPNHLHEEAVRLAAEAGKAILCTKPLGRSAVEARRMLDMAEEAGVFHGYLEDLVYTPKTLKAVQSGAEWGARGTSCGCARGRSHPGPHSAWFWDLEQAGGAGHRGHGLPLHRDYPLVRGQGQPARRGDVLGPIRSSTPSTPRTTGSASSGSRSGAVGQFEVSWAFRGGMDLRDEVSGTEGTIWLNHWLRTGFETFTTGEGGSYVAEKAETDSGWLFPGRRRSQRAWLPAPCSPTCSTRWTPDVRPPRPFTTATSSTP